MAPRSAPGIKLQRAIKIATRQFFGHTNSVHGASVIRRDRGVEYDDAYDLALQHHERLTELKMRLLGDRVSRRTAWKIAREHGWETTYDAEYLAVAKLQADALVTVTAGLAAKATDVVPLAPLEALSTAQD